MTASSRLAKVGLPSRFRWSGAPIGTAVEANLTRRLAEFVQDEESAPIALFSPDSKSGSDVGDWYGEHAGKWLCAMVSMWRATGPAELGADIARVVAKLLQWQESDGYLGTYAAHAKCRFTHPEASSVRTWDLWTHAWTMLGLIEAGAVPGCPEALPAAVRIGDLILGTFPESGRLLEQGNHDGLSSACVIEPLARLTLATGDSRYVDFAFELLNVGERRWGRGFLAAASSDVDVAEIGTGKAYQILWILVGLTYLLECRESVELRKSIEALWENVRDHHLSPLGGPWGGIAAHKEVFNPKGYFHPSGLVETCSTATWMELCRRLGDMFGEAKYAREYERSLANALLGAQDENGADWCYFTFANGRRNNTYAWACCKSSGALALANAWKVAVVEHDHAFEVNLHFPFSAEFGSSRIELIGDPVDGKFHLTTQGVDKPIRIVVPDWADDLLSDFIELPPEGGSFEFSAPIRVVPFTDTLDHHGQEIARTDYAFVSKGPFVYAASLFEGDLQQRTIRLARLNPANHIREDDAFPTLRLAFPGADPLYFLPYYLCGGRHDGAWRTTWFSVAWQ